MEFTKEELANEEWRDVVGYEGLYQVSSLGRVFSLKRQKMMKFYNHHGYNRLKIEKGGVVKDMAVHLLVANAFIINEGNLPFINHKDENKNNNRVDNLEWCTAQYNTDYSVSKPIAQYTKQGDLVAVYISLKEASRTSEIDEATIWSVATRKKGKSAGGFLWRYIGKGEYVDVNNRIFFTGLPYKKLFKDGRRPVRQYTKDGIFVREYSSAKEAGLNTPNTSQGSISSVCNKCYNTAGGFRWCYSHDTQRIAEIENLRKKSENSAELFAN